MSHIINDRLNQSSWALAAILLLPLLFTKGMFFDGLTYATVARNLNDGLGTFWTPYYTPYIHPEFYEHPPFSFALHSLFFRLFGDQIWVDRIYSYTMYGVSVLMMRRIWTLFIPAGHRAWIPQLLWTLTPTVIWVHQNNLLEAPLSAAVLAVVWLLFEGTIKRNYFWSVLAGVTFFFALGIKGPVALFPLMTLPIMAVLFPEHRKPALISMIIMIVSFSSLFSYFYLYEEAFSQFFSQYLDRQLIPSLLGKREQSGSVWMSLLEVGKQLVLPVLVFILLASKSKIDYTFRRESLFFFLLALCGTIPFFFMDRQHHYYFMPAMAYWMLGFAMLMEQAPYPWNIQRKKWVRFLSIANASIWFTAISLSIYFSRSPSRDKHLIRAIETIAEEYPGEHITVDNLPGHWKLNAIGARYGKVYFTDKPTSLYILEADKTASDEWEVVNSFDKAQLVLYKKAPR